MASIIHATAHGLSAGDSFQFANIEPAIAGPDENTVYYVLAAGLTADAFTFSDTPGGTAFVLSYDITSADIVAEPEYTLVVDGVMDPPDDPAAPTGLTLTSDVAIDSDGHQVVRVKAAFTVDTTPGLSGTKIELAKTSGLDWATAQVLRAPLGTSFVQFIVPGNVGYSVRAASESVYGAVSAYTSVQTITATKDSSAPATPTGLTATGGIQSVAFDWDANTEADLAYYEVQVDDNSGFTSPDTVTMKGNSLVYGPVAAGTWYAKVRAVDTSGNASSYTASANAAARLATVSDLDPSNIYENATNLTNNPATVVIDDDGITISDGALALQDEFGKTVLVASGFSGSWADFIAAGIYNARLVGGSLGSLGIGRNSQLPYWTVETPTNAAYNYVSDGNLEVTWSGLGSGAITSDLVPVIPGMAYEFGTAFKATWAAGILRVSATVKFYASDGTTLLSSAVTPVMTLATSVSSTRWTSPSAVLSPAGAAYGKVTLTATEATTHSATNKVTLQGGMLRAVGRAIPPDQGVDEDGVGLSAHLIAPTGVDDLALAAKSSYIELTPDGGDAFLTGIAAPNPKVRKIITIYNQSAYTLTLKNESTSSAAANRFMLPDRQDYVLQQRGGVRIMYDPDVSTSPWYLLDGGGGIAGQAVRDALDVGGALTVTGALSAPGGITNVPLTGTDTSFTITGGGGATYSAKNADYVKIGRLVVFRLSWTVSGNGSGATALSLASEDTGLPKAASNFMVWGDRGGTGVNRFHARVTNGTNEITFANFRLITALTTDLTGADLASGATYAIHGAYISAT